MFGGGYGSRARALCGWHATTDDRAVRSGTRVSNRTRAIRLYGRTLPCQTRQHLRGRPHDAQVQASPDFPRSRRLTGPSARDRNRRVRLGSRRRSSGAAGSRSTHERVDHACRGREARRGDRGGPGVGRRHHRAGGRRSEECFRRGWSVRSREWASAGVVTRRAAGGRRQFGAARTNHA